MERSQAFPYGVCLLSTVHDQRYATKVRFARVRGLLLGHDGESTDAYQVASPSAAQERDEEAIIPKIGRP